MRQLRKPKTLPEQQNIGAGCGKTCPRKTVAYSRRRETHRAPFGDPSADREYSRATQEFERIADKRPNDAFAGHHLLTSGLIPELYRMGAMTTGEYANDSFVGQAHRPADPKVKERIKQLVAGAQRLEDEQLKGNPNNVDALYSRG